MKRKTRVAAGGVVFRRTAAGVEVILGERSDWRTGADQVRLPKGHLERGESLEEAAIREVGEESGVSARVLSPVGETSYAYDHGKPRRSVAKRVHYFLMEYVSGEPEPRDGEMRRVYWCPIDEAVQRLTFDSERGAVEEARRLLSTPARD